MNEKHRQNFEAVVRALREAAEANPNAFPKVQAAREVAGLKASEWSYALAQCRRHDPDAARAYYELVGREMPIDETHGDEAGGDQVEETPAVGLPPPPATPGAALAAIIQWLEDLDRTAQTRVLLAAATFCGIPLGLTGSCAVDLKCAE